MSSIVAVGSVAFDSIQAPTGEANDVLGGSLSYFALAASHFSNVRMVGVVGTDFTDEHMSVFDRPTIDTGGLERVDGKTFRWSGKYLDDMNQRETLSLDLNVFEKFDPKVPTDVDPSDLLFLANGSPGLQLQTLDKMPENGFCLLDTMDFWIESDRPTLVEALTRIDGLVINDEEAKFLSGESNLIAAGNKILEMGPKIVIVKKGEHGAFLFSTYLHYALPAYPIENVYDPTGAGDTFAGGVMGYLARGGRVTLSRIKKAMIYGTIMASFCVEKFGPDRLLEVTEDEIRDRYEDFVQFTTP